MKIEAKYPIVVPKGVTGTSSMVALVGKLEIHDDGEVTFHVGATDAGYCQYTVNSDGTMVTEIKP